MDVFESTELLQAHRLRPTLARISVLKLFKGEQSYTPGQVYRVLVQQGEEVSLATTYRTLAHFVDVGLLSRQQLDNGPGRYFLPVSQSTEHILCTECGALLPMPEPEIANLLKKLAAKHGYLLAEYELFLYGKCMACSRKNIVAEQTQRSLRRRPATCGGHASIK